MPRGRAAVTSRAGVPADGCGGFDLSGGLPVAQRADEPARLGAVEHYRQGLAVLEGAEPEQRGHSSGTYPRAVLVGVDDERRAELRSERGEGASCLRPLLERARVVAEEDVDVAAGGEALQGGPLARGGTMPVATSRTRSDGKGAAVGETAQAAEPEARSGRQVVNTETERHRAGGGAAGLGARERLGVVVVSLHEHKLEAGQAKQCSGGAEEAAPFGVARQVAEVAKGDERVAALLDGALDQAAQLASIAVQVAKGEQTAHSRRAYRARSCPRTDGSTRAPGRRTALLHGIRASISVLAVMPVIPSAISRGSALWMPNSVQHESSPRISVQVPGEIPLG